MDLCNPVGDESVESPTLILKKLDYHRTVRPETDLVYLVRQLTSDAVGQSRSQDGGLQLKTHDRHLLQWSETRPRHDQGGTMSAVL